MYKQDIKYWFYKNLAIFTVLTMIGNIVQPNFSFGQTTNSRSNYASQSPSGGTNVDPFTGDFSYSIPLLDVEGFPIMISYNADVRMHDEASWVGLGWDLNLGAINRQKRGLPDDFNGDQIEQTVSSKPEKTDGTGRGSSFSLGLSAGFTFAGQLGAGAGLNIGGSIMRGNFFNSYKGDGSYEKIQFDIGFSVFGNVGPISASVGPFANVTRNENNQNGIGFNTSAGISGSVSIGPIPIVGGTAGGGTQRNFRQGTKSKTSFSTESFGFSSQTKVTTKTLGYPAFTPKLNTDFVGGGETYLVGRGAYLGVSIPLNWGTGAVGFGDDVNPNGSLGFTIDAQGLNEEFSDRNFIKDKTISKPAYGFINYHNAKSSGEVDQDAILDFNREKEIAVKPKVKRLPSSSMTYDLFQVSGPGIGGVFRSFRNDIGTVGDPIQSISGEFYNDIDKRSYGLWAKIYDNTSTTLTSTKIGRENGSSANGTFVFKSESDVNTREYEPAFFKFAGEMTPNDESLISQFGGTDPVKLGVNLNEGVISEANYFTAGNSQTHNSLPSSNYQGANSKAIRASYIREYKVSELNDIGLYTKIRDYDLLVDGQYSTYSYDEIYRDNTTHSYRKDHHISMIDVTTTNGALYRYGLPTYSIEENEVQFSISKGSGSAAADYSNVHVNGLVGYIHNGSNPDNSIDNKRGKNNFYQKVSTPGYANSFLLTEIFSSNYADVTGDGPTIDDVGSYVKVNYSMLYGGSDPVQWRSPYSEKAATVSGYPRAGFHEGHNSDPYDDNAYYNHGKKEEWYVHTVETKNYIAEFYLGDRKDAMSVKDENGEFLSSKALKKLDKIVLYNREDRLRNGANATPLKTVEFEYDYSLCNNFPGNIDYINNTGNSLQRGKLTLKNIIFSSGGSEEYSLTPYEFTYSSENPDFGNLDVNRWGYYQVNDSDKPNSRYPYASYSLSTLEDNCQAWKLVKITQPTGGEMTIDYEPDRFSYVQNKRTMKFFKVLGFGKWEDHDTEDLNPNIDNSLRDGVKEPQNVIYFQLEDNILESTYQESYEKFLKDYFDMDSPNEAIPNIFYQMDVSIQAQANDGQFMSGFLSSSNHIQSVGIVGDQSSGYNYGYIKLYDRSISYMEDINGIPNKQYSFNSLQKLFTQYLRVNLPHKIFANVVGETNTGEPIYLYHLGYDNLRMSQDATSFLDRLSKAHFCRYVNLDESFIRLHNPSNVEYTGGARVAKITVNDKWETHSGETNNEGEYITEYFYDEDPEKVMPTGGVASWVPLDGNDLNPFYQPLFYSVKNFYIPSDFNYQAEKMGEMHLPSPVVGYSKVVKKFGDISGLSATATGKSESYFNTSKDYPYSFKHTPLKHENSWYIDKSNSTSYFASYFSQGYAFRVNNFHGKIKETRSLDELNNVISSTTYEYYDVDDKQKVVNENGVISESNLAREIDVVVDKTVNYNSVKMEGDVESVTVPLIPIPSINEAYISMNLFQKEYRNVVTKVITDYAKIKKVNTYSLGNDYVSEVLAYDKFSGSPISMKTTNEFNDNTYGLALPSYWKYNQLGNKFTSEKLKFTYGSSADVYAAGNGYMNVYNDIEYFNVGDVIHVQYGTNHELLYVLSVDESNNKIKLIDENGDDFSPAAYQTFEIVWSGVKNRVNESMMSVGQIVTNPIGAVSSSINIDESNILSADATEYKYSKGNLCNGDLDCEGRSEETCGLDISSPINPFFYGLFSNLYPTRNYVYQGAIEQSSVTAEVNSITDGRFSSFLPFYEFVSGSWVKITESSHPDYISAANTQNWKLIGDATRWDEFGRVVETKDALGRRSSVLYGYNATNKLVPVATSFNAKISEIAMDGFEGANYFNFESACTKKPHFSFTTGVGTFDVSSTEVHTGNNALKITPGNSCTVNALMGGVCDPKITPPEVNPEDGLFYPYSCDCLPMFSPDGSKDYWVSIWVKEDASVPDTYSDLELEVKFKNGTTTVSTISLTPSGKQIDGWQRIEGKIEVPTGTLTCIEISLKNTGSNTAYFDDFRFHPYKATMVTAVFDDKYLLPMATLNTNNFATYYHYDENLSLSKIMKETTDGKQTVAEFKGGIVKSSTPQP